jgi:hypothetical protein
MYVCAGWKPDPNTYMYVVQDGISTSRNLIETRIQRMGGVLYLQGEEDD